MAKKRKVREINTCNQFCGAGSCEHGIRRAIVEGLKKIFKGVAINHWDRAVETMRANFPEINTVSCKIEEALPDELVPDGVELHLLWSSPSCFTAGHLVTTTEGQKPIESVRVGDIVLTGTKTEQIRQVGNGVPARTARALVETLLREYIE